MICSYGCGQEAKFKFKNNKVCCSRFSCQCSYIKTKNCEKNLGHKVLDITKEKIRKKITNTKRSIDTIEKISKAKKGSIPWNKGKVGAQVAWNKGKVGVQVAWNKGKENCFSKETTSKMRESRKKENLSINTLLKMKISHQIRIEKIKIKYPFFSKIEEMRYNPEKENEIQVHCKNHDCPNSKEKSGWFTPTRGQLFERIRQLEKEFGNEGSYFYCSVKCKNTCPVYRLQNDPYKKEKKLYTEEEYQTFRKFVLERDNYICQFCGEKATEVHHERPQKLEPFFALDLDYALSCCKDCHYKYGHKNECSTGNLALKIC
jgi:hypothetical protein